MAGVAQLVRASVCGTECRQFESGHPPHKIQTRIFAGLNFIRLGQMRTGEKASRPAAKRRNNAGLPSGKFCKGAKQSGHPPHKI